MQNFKEHIGVIKEEPAEYEGDASALMLSRALEQQDGPEHAQPRAGTHLSLDYHAQERAGSSRQTNAPVVFKTMGTYNFIADGAEYSDSQESDKSEDDFYYIEQKKLPKNEQHGRRATELSGQQNKENRKPSAAKQSILNIFKKSKIDNNLEEKMLYESTQK